MDSAQLHGTAATSQAPPDEWTIGDEMPRSQRKRFDPIEVLPEEIWIAMIADSASEMRPDAAIVISQDTLLDLMQVSRLWNIRISSSPTLWVDIILEDEYDAAAKAYLALHYSRQAQLALYMHYPTGWWDTLQGHILANRARITKLFFYSHSGTSFSGAILRTLSPLPHLASFYHRPFLYPSWDDSLNYPLDSPLTRTNIWLDRSILEQRTTRELRGIRLPCELEDVFDLLEESEYLQEVLVRPRLIAMNYNPMQNIKESFLQGPPLPWMSLKYHSDRDLFVGAIIGRLPKLVELRIRISQKIFRHIMPLIFQLENLSIFDVTLVGEWNQFDRLVIPRGSTSVREASISIGCAVSPIIEPAVDALFRCLANIRFLRLQVVDLPTIRMLTSSTGFQYLQTLWISTIINWEDSWSDSDGVLEPFATSVERVTYWINGPSVKPLIPLQLHYITSLEICCLTLLEMELYSQHWTALRTITVDHNTTVNWKGPTYRQLHSISLKTFLGHSMIRGGRNGTKLCRDIALHAEYFPVLNKLEFEACPELDILFILLETRNVSTRPGISPISTLIIPTRCPPFLVERLRDLVNGIKHCVSSYYELSIAGNYDIITDASITGCVDCHRALRFCTQPVESRGARFPALVMEYPESVTRILESWDARAEEFYPLERRLRVTQCVKKFPPVSIVR